MKKKLTTFVALFQYSVKKEFLETKKTRTQVRPKKLKQREKYEVNLSEARQQGRGEWRFNCGKSFFERLENPDVTDGDVAVAVEVLPRGGNFECIVSCEGWIETTCDRCLDALRVDVDESYTTPIICGDSEADDVEAVVVEEDAVKASLESVIADTIVLALPLRKVHPEGECNPAMEEALHRLDTAVGSLGSLLDEESLEKLRNNK